MDGEREGSGRANFLLDFALEWIADGEVEGQQLLGLLVGDHPGASLFALWIIELRPDVEAQDEVIKVPTQAQPRRQGDLLVEAIPLEVALGLILVGAHRPDVARVSEERQLQGAKDLHPILGVELELDIPDLVEDRTAGRAGHAPRAQRAGSPASQAIRPAGEVAQVDGHVLAIAVGIGDGESQVVGEGIPFAELAKTAVVGFGLDELGEVRPEEGVRTVDVSLTAERRRKPVEQAPRRLEEEAEVVHPGRRGSAVIVERVVAEEVGGAEDELVSVVEDLRDQRHRPTEVLVDVAEVQEVQVDDLEVVAVGRRVVTMPAMAPLQREDITAELWAPVVIVAHLQVRRRLDGRRAFRPDEGEEELGEGQAYFSPVVEMLVAPTPEALVAPTKL